jgi:sugar-specific transcriptional regulator TrmB
VTERRGTIITRHESDAKVLTQLGLTNFQAEVYLTLTKLGVATAKTIATTDNLDRANVYRVMAELQQLNLIEKMIAKPTKFKAVPINEGIQILLENREKEFKAIFTKTQEIIEKYKKSKIEIKPEDECQFALIPDNKAIIRKIGEMKERCHESYDFIFCGRSFLETLDRVKIFLKELIKKGVTVRIIVCLNEGERLYKEYLNLGKNLNLRYTFSEPSITLTVCDKKEALINTMMLAPTGEPSLWSNNPVIVNILQNYFNHRWHNSNQISQTEETNIAETKQTNRS